MSSTDSTTTAQGDAATDKHRLPCRGCTRDCANYATCGGKPWRIGEAVKQA